MHAFLPTCAAVLSCTLILGGCGSTRTSDYPDNSPETTRRVDDTKRNAQDKKNAIDREYADKSNNLDFRERQVREKYKAEREELSIKTDQELTKLNAQRKELELKNAQEDNRNNATVTKNLSDIRKEIEALERDALEKRQRIDTNEKQELIQLEKERNQANEAMREEKLEVDRWTTKELESIDNNASKKN